MAFKFPRPLFPFGGGARSVDPETVIVDDSGIPTRFGDTIAAAPGRPAGSAPARRRITLPLLDRLPKRGQLAVLFPVLGLSLLLAFVFMWLDSRQAGAVAIQTRLVGDSLMHSQRLAKAAPMAVRGGGDAFRQLAESRSRLSEAVAALQSGDVVREQRVEPVDAALQPALARLAEPWKRTDQAAATLTQLQPTLSSIAQAARTVLEAQPRIVEFAEQVTALKAAVPAPAPEIAAAAQLQVLAHRIARQVVQLTGGDAVNLELSAVLARDTAALRDTIEALLAGSEARRLAPAREGEQRARLGELKAAYAELDTPIASLIADLPRMPGARAAETRIGADSEPLRAGLLDLQSRLAEAGSGRGLQQGLAVGFLLLALLAALGLGLVHYQDVDRRAADADAQRAEAERLEQDAKRTNDQNQAAILRLMNELQEVADGDLTIQATVTEDITGAIADSVNYTVEELRNLVSRINTTAELVADASSKAQTVSSGLQSASEQQSREIRETGEAVLRMASQIKEVSASASESAQVARQSLGAAEQGRRAVQNAIAGMNGIRDQIQETAKRIKRLGESSQEIGEIVELISDITEQTNVLALNAAIQAASAGEAGRGFTVVAEEVQRLAERSAEATRQISALIRTIQVDTQDAVAAMERSTQGVVAGTRLSDDAGNALAEIGRVATQLAELIEDISRTTSGQASSAGTVAHSIQRILLVTEQTSEGTQQTAGSILQLAELARELKNSVSRFRVQ
ncbi:MAG: methyl-accepting chemotaxis protein [Burkholderiales bacterium]|nr:methyl-accepting chemotaxis protein [Burkholderiales bacterium]